LSVVPRDDVRSWLDAYERAWRSAGTAAVHELFVDDATYSLAPYEEPTVGIEAIAAMWEREREGPDERFTMTSEIVAVEGDTAVARVQVAYAGPPPRDYRDLWVMRFDGSGRCRAFEEWPFWPGRARVMQA
jgi:ketosteroid isomerase-like protein